jgi:Flp pilus assembly protein TadD
MFGSLSKTTNLREQLQEALRAKRLGEALDIYALIEQRRPDEPRWPHRRGDLLQRMGRAAEAVLAYEHAVELYAAKGFVARAEAMTKVASAVQPASCGSPRRAN